MPDSKQLTPAEVYRKLTRWVAYLSRFAWLMRFVLLISTIAFMLSLCMGEFQAALVFLFCTVAAMLAVLQQNQHKLLLKLLPDPEGTPREDGANPRLQPTADNRG